MKRPKYPPTTDSVTTFLFLFSTCVATLHVACHSEPYHLNVQLCGYYYCVCLDLAE
jgi:hypothetical protein